MELSFNNEFYEMQQGEMQEIVGGDIDWGAAADALTNFCANRLIWSVAKYTMTHFSLPIRGVPGDIIIA